MSAHDGRLAEIRAKVESTRAAQGLPPRVEDPTVLGRAADLFRLVEPARNQGAAA